MKILATEGTTRWDEMHRSPQLITGSRAASIMGYGYQSPFEVWGEMRGELEPKDFTYEGIQWGHDLEDGVAKRWQRDRDRQTEASGEPRKLLRPSPGLVAHPELQILAGTPDRLIAEQDAEAPGTITCFGRPEYRYVGVYEGKCTEVWNKIQWVEGPPLRARIQAQFYLDLCELDWCSVCGFLGISEPPVIEDAPRDDAFIAHMRVFLTDWYERHVVKGVPPEPGGGDRDRDLVRALHGAENTGKVFFLPQELDDLGERIKELRAQRAAADKELKPLENQFKLAFGDNSVGHGSETTWKLTYSEAEVHAHTRKGLRLTPSARKSGG